MSVLPASACRKPGKRSGFALLITVTLLAFLVLLLVSLASLTRVETQVAANSQQLSQARQNALMALNIALGELQKYAGPDQRTTARSDLDAALVNTSVKSGRWIGVYGSGVSANYADVPSAIASKIAADAASGPANGSQARLLNWLVSGNEGTVFDPGSAVAADGHVTAAPSAFAFQPTDAVAGLSGSPTVGGKEARLLVGPGTVGASVNDYVAAPLMNIEAASGQVPGISGGATIGRYAWWVGDENAKARINLPLTQDAAKLPQAFVNASRAAVELVDAMNVEGAAGTAPAGAATNRLASYDPTTTANAEAIPRLLNTNQLEMLGTDAAAVNALTTARKYRFHDLTSVSWSVLSDAYAGGLKKDLSALLASGSASPAATDYLFVPQSEGISPITTRASTNTYGVPTWGMLRSFATTRVPAAARAKDPRLPSDIETGIAPVLTNATVGLQYMADDNVQGTPIRLALFPLAVLWNPYTFAIRGAKYEFGVVRRYTGQLQLQARLSDGPPVPPSTDPTPRWRVKETRDFQRAGGLVTGGGASLGVDPMVPGSGYADPANTVVGTSDATQGSYLRFVIDASDVELQPGQSMVFTLPAGSHSYSAPANGAPANELKRGLRTSAHASFPSVCSIGPDEINYRVATNGAGTVASALPRTMFTPGNRNTNFSGGEVDAYLGQVASNAPDGFGLEPGGSGIAKPWYQSISRSFGGGGSTLTVIKDGITFPSVPTTGREILIAVRANFASGATRWIAQNNLRAPLQTRAPLDEGRVPAFYGYGAGSNWVGYNASPGSDMASSGISLDADTAVTDTTLFEYLPDDVPLMSLGQLQHANLSKLITYPSYPLGNSLADYHFRDSVDPAAPANPPNLAHDYIASLVRTDGMVLSSPTNSNAPSQLITAYYDVSYLLNRALWDRYFVSTVPHSGTAAAGSATGAFDPVPPVLANARHVRQAGFQDVDLRDAHKAAAGLMTSGGFNINSTSEQAWRAVLGGINRLSYDPVAGTGGAELKAALPRFARPTSTAVAASQPWQGYRQLTDVQIAELARNIVAEVRNRGPFVSMGDFINRRLRDNPATTSATLNADERFKGPIQNAIDAGGTLTGSNRLTGVTGVNVGTTNAVSAAAPFTTQSQSHAANTKWAYTDISLMRGGPAAVAPYSTRSAFAPQFLTQADVLSAIGGGLSARSDTFVIRTCGESVNPVLASSDAGYVTGRVWCEAVVQRVVEPVVRKNSDPAVADYNEPAVPSAGQADFGRRFKVVSFRWLTANDI